MYSSSQSEPFFQSPSQNNDGLFSAFLTDKKSELQPEILTKVKNELSKKWLKKDRLDSIHAIGIGNSERHGDCIQVFTNDVESFTAEIPKEYAKIPIGENLFGEEISYITWTEQESIFDYI